MLFRSHPNFPVFSFPTLFFTPFTFITMRFTSITAAAVLAFCSSALATSALDGSENKMVTKRTPAAGGPTDVEILNYALTLEYLERDFYAEGLSKYSAADFKKAGFSQTVYDRFKMIGAQEKDHVAFLVSLLPSLRRDCAPRRRASCDATPRADFSRCRLVPSAPLVLASASTISS